MARIIEDAEHAAKRVHAQVPVTGQVLGRVVAKAATQIADDVDARAILVFSLSGASVQLVSKFRPKQPVIGLTPDPETLTRLALMWGTSGTMVTQKDDSVALVEVGERICLERGYGVRGDSVVVVSGVPGGHGGTNRVMVHRLGDALT
jgi:pyruvate kinase